MVKTSSLKVQQRKRKLIRRAEARARLRELKGNTPSPNATVKKG